MGAVLQEGDGYMETMTNLNGHPIKGWDDEENNHKQSENWVQKKFCLSQERGKIFRRSGRCLIKLSQLLSRYTLILPMSLPWSLALTVLKYLLSCIVHR